MCVIEMKIKDEFLIKNEEDKKNIIRAIENLYLSGTSQIVEKYERKIKHKKLGKWLYPDSILVKIIAFCKASRVEFSIIYLPIFYFLATDSLSDILNVILIEVIMLLFVCQCFGSGINSLYDLRLDSKYKSHLSSAVETLGKNNLKYILIFESIIIISIGVHLSIWLGRPILLFLVVIGMFFAIAYSADPFRFKGRGVLNSITLFLILFFIPAAVSWFVVRATISISIAVIIIGYSLLQYGITIIQTAEDYSEELSERVRTPPVVMGLSRALSVSIGLAIVGGSMLSVGYLLIGGRHVTMLIITIPHVFILGDIISLKFKSRKSPANIEQLIKGIGKKNVVPIWLMISTWSILIGNIVYHIGW